MWNGIYKYNLGFRKNAEYQPSPIIKDGMRKPGGWNGGITVIQEGWNVKIMVTLEKWYDGTSVSLSHWKDGKMERWRSVTS